LQNTSFSFRVMAMQVQVRDRQGPIFHQCLVHGVYALQEYGSKNGSFVDFAYFTGTLHYGWALESEKATLGWPNHNYSMYLTR